MIRLPIRPIYALIALLSGLGILISTAQHGIGYSADSSSYLAGAHALGSDGLLTESQHLRHFPPLQSGLLLLVDANPEAVIPLNMLIMMANIAVFGELLTQMQIKIWFGAVMLIALALAPEMVFRHSMIMSEPFFLLLCLLTTLSLVRRWWIGVLIFASLAPLQRYAGVSLIGAAGLYLLWQGERDGKPRLRNFAQSAAVVIITLLPSLWWMTRANGQARPLVFHLIAFDQVKSGLLTLGGRYWLLPLGTLAVALTWINRRSIRQIRPPGEVLFALIFCLIYLAFLLVSISLFDHFTPLDSRILSPILVFGWLILTWWIDGQLGWLPAAQRTLAIGVFAVLIGGFMAYGVSRVAQSYEQGVGLARYIRAEYDDALAALPPGLTLYSNHTTIVAMIRDSDERLDFGVNSLPTRYDPVTLVDNPDYAIQFAAFADQLQAGAAVVIWFEEVKRPYETGLDEFIDLAPRTRIGEMLLIGHLE